MNRFPFLILLAWLALLSSCKKVDPRVGELLQQIDKLEDDIKADEKANAVMVETMSSHRQAMDRIRTDIAQQAIEIRQLGEEVNKTAEAFMAYHMDYQKAIWAKAPNTNLGEIKVGGQTYFDVVLKSINWDEINIQHRGGVAKIPTSELPENLSRLFGFELPQALADLSPVTAIATPSTVKWDSAPIALSAPPSLELSSSKPSNSTNQRPPPPKRPGVAGAFSDYRPVGKNYKTLWHDYRSIGGK